MKHCLSAPGKFGGAAAVSRSWCQLAILKTECYPVGSNSSNQDSCQKVRIKRKCMLLYQQFQVRRQQLVVGGSVFESFIFQISLFCSVVKNERS